MTVLILLALYLVGSIPFGLLLTRWAGLGDIRKTGSGNIGATNVLRTGNKKIALATLLMDFLKGFLPLMLLRQDALLFEELACAATLAVMAGHIFPIWLSFKGGKGVATLFGCAFALSWVAGLCFAVGWLLMFVLTRISALGAVVGIPAGMIAYTVVTGNALTVSWLLLPVLIMIARHHENIRRLLRGEESRFKK